MISERGLAAGAVTSEGPVSSVSPGSGTRGRSSTPVGSSSARGKAPADLVLFGAGKHGLQGAAAVLGPFGQLLEGLQRVGEAVLCFCEGDLADGGIGALLAQVVV
jgi:hypothetical protein